MAEHGKDDGWVPKSYSEFTNSDYLSADDLQGREVTVTLERMIGKNLESNSGKVSPRLIFKLKGKSKSWVSNVTNNLCLAAMFGDEPGDAVGHRVVLRSEEVMGPGGKKVPGIRIAGSPDIDKDIKITIKLPHKSAQDRTLRKFREPGED